MDAQVVEWVAAFSYPAVLLLLVLCGVGAPLSEELIVIAGGLVVARSSASLPGMMVAAYVGMLIGDSLLFASAHAGPRALPSATCSACCLPRARSGCGRCRPPRGLGAVSAASCPGCVPPCCWRPGPPASRWGASCSRMPRPR